MVKFSKNASRTTRLHPFNSQEILNNFCKPHQLSTISYQRPICSILGHSVGRSTTHLMDTCSPLIFMLELVYFLLNGRMGITNIIAGVSVFFDRSGAAKLPLRPLGRFPKLRPQWSLSARPARPNTISAR